MILNIMFISFYHKDSAQVRPRQCACGGVVLEGAARRSWWIVVSSRTDPGLWAAVGNFLPPMEVWVWTEGRYGLRTLVTIMWGCPRPCSRECEAKNDWGCFGLELCEKVAHKRFPEKKILLRVRKVRLWWDLGEDRGKKASEDISQKKSGCC